MTATGEGMSADLPTDRLARLMREIDAAIRDLSRNDNPAPAQ
jgi:hypothetical protein